jgi:hypothetical protein
MITRWMIRRRSSAMRRNGPPRPGQRYKYRANVAQFPRHWSLSCRYRRYRGVVDPTCVRRTRSNVCLASRRRLRSRSRSRCDRKHLSGTRYRDICLVCLVRLAPTMEIHHDRVSLSNLSCVMRAHFSWPSRRARVLRAYRVASVAAGTAMP